MPPTCGTRTGAVALGLALLCGLAGPAAGADQRPNFVLILADDLGYGDLACYGADDLITPHIDQLAQDGLRLTSCYSASANCSPARAGLMTGRTPYRVGIHNWISAESPMHLRESEITIARLLQDAGYATCHVGKWHLNGKFDSPEQPQPGDHGFDHWFSTQNNALPCHRDPDNFVRNGEPVGKLEGYSADIVAGEAEHWLRELRPKDKPFFLFVCFHEPHEPIASDPKYTALYPDTGKRSPYDPDVSSLAAHHGNITQLDAGVGQVLGVLDDLGLRDDTLVFFTSDNGPAITGAHPHGSPGPLREKKGHLYEGGIRVPGILRWPDKVPVGKTSDEPICGVDVLPTFCELAGVKPPKDRKIDGTSFTPVFDGKSIRRRTPLYWQFNVARSRPKVAMRQGDWKILATLTGRPPEPTGAITEEFGKHLKEARLLDFYLYDLSEDIGEKRDMVDDESFRLRVIARTLRALYDEIREETPVWPAFDWPRKEGERIRELRERLQREQQQSD